MGYVTGMCALCYYSKIGFVIWLCSFFYAGALNVYKDDAFNSGEIKFLSFFSS